MQRVDEILTNTQRTIERIQRATLLMPSNNNNNNNKHNNSRSPARGVPRSYEPTNSSPSRTQPEGGPHPQHRGVGVVAVSPTHRSPRRRGDMMMVVPHRHHHEVVPHSGAFAAMEERVHHLENEVRFLRETQELQAQHHHGIVAELSREVRDLRARLGGTQQIVADGEREMKRLRDAAPPRVAMSPAPEHHHHHYPHHQAQPYEAATVSSSLRRRVPREPTTSTSAHVTPQHNRQRTNNNNSLDGITPVVATSAPRRPPPPPSSSGASYRSASSPYVSPRPLHHYNNNNNINTNQFPSQGMRIPTTATPTTIGSGIGIGIGHSPLRDASPIKQDEEKDVEGVAPRRDDNNNNNNDSAAATGAADVS
eukprot:PhM_4_TR16122/c3_g2_i1/m.101368